MQGKKRFSRFVVPQLKSTSDQKVTLVAQRASKRAIQPVSLERKDCTRRRRRRQPHSANVYNSIPECGHCILRCTSPS